jgi:hypothetical protein
MLRNIKNICNRKFLSTGKNNGILETVLFDRINFHITYFSLLIKSGTTEKRILVETLPGVLGRVFLDENMDTQIPDKVNLYHQDEPISAADYPVETLVGLPVYGRDGLLGTTSTLVVDDTSWIIRYLIVDVANSGNESRLPVDTGRVEDFDAKEGCIYIDASLKDLYA